MKFKKLACMLAIFLMFFQGALAETTTAEITAPLTKILQLVQAIVSIVAVIAITIGGARYMFSGDNIQAREGAKNMLSYAIVGLVVIWIAPFLVSYLSAPAM